jgi:(p)ppGpp synthase/HD superfamily hydrolase
MLDKAIRIAAQAFEGKYDKGGSPYILHCLNVMNAVKEYGEDYMIVGVLHDLLEDTDWTPEMLREEGFSHYDIVIPLMLLTHYDEDETYEDYIKRIRNSNHKMSIRIKMADLRHNSDIHRMKGLREKDFARLEKYHKAYAYLRDFKG